MAVLAGAVGKAVEVSALQVGGARGRRVPCLQRGDRLGSCSCALGASTATAASCMGWWWARGREGLGPSVLCVAGTIWWPPGRGRRRTRVSRRFEEGFLGGPPFGSGKREGWSETSRGFQLLFWRSPHFDLPAPLGGRRRLKIPQHAGSWVLVSLCGAIGMVGLIRAAPRTPPLVIVPNGKIRCRLWNISSTSVWFTLFQMLPFTVCPSAAFVWITISSSVVPQTVTPTYFPTTKRFSFGYLQGIS